jgi:hypothetical protein
MRRTALCDGGRHPARPRDGTESLEALWALSGRSPRGRCRDGGRLGAHDSLPIGKLSDSSVRRSQRAERLHSHISKHLSPGPAMDALDGGCISTFQSYQQVPVSSLFNGIGCQRGPSPKFPAMLWLGAAEAPLVACARTKSTPPPPKTLLQPVRSAAASY